MKLTHATRYALEALAFLGTKGRGRSWASREIAEARGVPDRFLLKVLKLLVSARMLRSVKGPRGGYRLVRAPTDISLLDVLEAVEGPLRGEAPLPFDRAPGVLDRRLERICNRTAEQIRQELDKVRLSELARGV